MSQTEIRVSEIREKIVVAFTKAGIPLNDAKIVTEVLIDAEIKGISTHGIMRLKPYITSIQNHRISATPQISMKSVGDGMFLVDGGNGLGQVVTMYTLQSLLQYAVCDGFHVCRFINELQELILKEETFADA